MKKCYITILGLVIILSFTLFIGCSEDDKSTGVSTHYADQNWASADLPRGGQLYDKWWVVNDGTEPTTNFDPIWSTQSTNTRTNGDTWRCKECHGWDYQGSEGAYGSGSHYTGFAGVWDARTQDKTVVFDNLKGDGYDHDFSSTLSDEDVLDLTKFVIDGLIDMSLYVDYNTKTSLGDPTAGNTLYTANCSVCHGALGIYGGNQAISDLANDNPWETLHKIRFGHPGSVMPSMVEEGLTPEEAADILAYVQGLEVPFVELNWGSADLARGGQLYDKWWVVNSGAVPTTNFDPIWSTQSTNTRTNGDTWRCKECHGWDYQGADGAYSSGSHYTGFTGVWDAGNLDKTVVFDNIMGEGQDHDFSATLSDVDVLDLTKFVLDGQIDMSLYIDYNTKASLGNPVAGQSLYSANCNSCHGPSGIYSGNLFIADLANDNPWETLHKIRFGHPGSLMPSAVENGLTEIEISDILAYCQGL